MRQTLLRLVSQRWGFGDVAFLRRLTPRALTWALLLWIVGFVWGSIVFAIPQLKSLPSIPYISKYPAISAPLLILYVPLLVFAGRRELSTATTRQCLKFGAILSASTIILDLAVYFLILHSADYFLFLSVWASYVLLLLVPALSYRRVRGSPG